MKPLLFFLTLLVISCNVLCQEKYNTNTIIIKSDSLLSDTILTKKTKSTLYKNREIVTATLHGTLISTSLIILNKYWYADYPRQHIASFNDSKEWLQMDKFGHVFSTYLESRSSAALWKWAGMNSKKSVLLGGLFGFAYQTSFEILDGTSAEYGFSWADMAANTFGAGLLIGQEYAWGEQRIQPKVSYSRQKYEASLLARIHNLYGIVGTERFLKDYNGQTHWLSVNLKSFNKNSKLPGWFNIAIGIGADGMLGGFENKWKDASGNTVTRYDIKRQRQFYIAPDIDFTKIKTNKKGLKVLFHIMNLVKFPAPGLELTGGKLKVKGIAY